MYKLIAIILVVVLAVLILVISEQIKKKKPMRRWVNGIKKTNKFDWSKSSHASGQVLIESVKFMGLLA